MADLNQHPPLADPDLQRYDLSNKRYPADDCIVICRVKDPFGHLLNMSSQYPMIINEVKIKSVEALYQSIRFPHHPDLQKDIIEEPSPLIAKDYAKAGNNRGEGRSDWYQKKVKVMRWCIRVKLACHYRDVGKLLNDTVDKDIVETSPDGHFWGGEKDGDFYVGANVFGQLLMELRNEYRTKTETEIKNVELLDIDDFLLYGEPITTYRRGLLEVKKKKKIVPQQDPNQLGFGF
jgi:ribA/ribD-fused uncharacterized protein